MGQSNCRYGTGVSRIAEVLDLAVEYDIIQKRGSWFRYDGEPIGQGADSAMQFLEEDPDLLDKIEKMVRAQLNGLDIEIKGATAELAEAEPSTEKVEK